ncbi:DUF4292 domain-containing protein [Rasiella rasia]|uniref:DUF4292 domain-containing protein n=1 Tax=Rasiella rasia TaxID=2744027 RepID=A0A6G6GN51_9FLAO|nr:DUF4292 domain-containing protein [Rasiella rasia]QIE59954.1 DUF4292 domain-containing protein [Rasiella rasia]
MKKFIVVVVLALFVVGCKGTKSVSGTVKNLSVKNIATAHNNASPNFKTLAARVFVVYRDEKKEQSITISVRMEKDKTIWMKASLLGITLAKAKITTERVQYYETVGKTYFDGDFSLLSNWLGTEINFQQAQSILLGESIFNLNQGNYTSEVVADKYKVQPKNQDPNFIYSLLMLSGNFRIASETLSQPDKGRILTIRYDDYQTIEGALYPKEIHVLASENDSTTKIDLTYRKIEPNVSISFPFTIPDGYSEMKL